MQLSSAAQSVRRDWRLPQYACGLVSLRSEQWVLGVAWVQAREWLQNPSVRKLEALKSPNTLLAPPPRDSPPSLERNTPVGGFVPLPLHLHTPTRLDRVCTEQTSLDLCSYKKPGTIAMRLLCSEKMRASISRAIYTGPEG